jgi:uncharacterized membrane protein
MDALTGTVLTWRMTGLRFALTLATALGCGLASGVFFVFSTMVMPALATLPPAQGIAAMNAMNRTVGPPFLLPLLATAAGCVALIAWTLLARGGTSAGLLLAGAALYLVGVIVVTGAANVPMNDALAASPHDTALWSDYLDRWTAWNHVRGAAGLVASGLLVAALAA